MEKGREAVGSGTDGRSVRSSKGKRGSGKWERVSQTRETGGREENVKATVVVRGRGEVKNPSAVAGPGLAGEGRVEGDDKLAGGVDGVGGKVEGHTVETMVDREGRVEGPCTHMVEGELGLWEQVVPAVRGESDVGGREDSNDVVLGGTYCTFHRV